MMRNSRFGWMVWGTSGFFSVAFVGALSLRLRHSKAVCLAREGGSREDGEGGEGGGIAELSGCHHLGMGCPREALHIRQPTSGAHLGLPIVSVVDRK